MTGARSTMTRRVVAAIAAACIMCGWPAFTAGQQATPGRVEEYEEIYLQAFADMDHPGPFDASGEGYVAVKLTLDRHGNVKDAVALSGPRGLVQPAVENAKKLRVQPTSSRTVVVVYQFAVVDACFGTSYWFESNLIRITGCRKLYSPW